MATNIGIKVQTYVTESMELDSPVPSTSGSWAEFVRQKRWKKDAIYVPSLFNKRWHRLPPFMSNEPGTGLINTRLLVYCPRTKGQFSRSWLRKKQGNGVNARITLFSLRLSLAGVYHSSTPVPPGSP
jgi:hypothetical protein